MNRKFLLLIFTLVIFSGLKGHAPLAFSFSYDKGLSKKKQLVLTLTLAPGHVLVKNSLRFSVDVPHVYVKKWQVKASSVTRYVPAFKKNKKVHEGAVPIILTFGRLKSTLHFDKSKAHIYLFGVMIDPMGHAHSEVSMIPFDKGQRERSLSNAGSKSGMVNVVPSPVQNSFSPPKREPLSGKSSDDFIKIGEYLKKKIQPLLFYGIEKYKTISKQRAFYLIFILLFFGLLLIALSPSWRKEIYHLMRISLVASALWFMYGKISDQMVGIGILIFLLFNAFYYLSDNNDEAPILGYVKWAVGAICIFLTPSFVVYLFLLRNESFLLTVLSYLKQ